MAFFGVTIETISGVRDIEGADRIQVASLVGSTFQFVIGKGSFKAGDKCYYFPVDSLIPQELAARLKVEGKLAGKEKNRIKTVRLRGELSQGIVASLDLCSLELRGEIDPEKIAAHFGVVKYEPPEQIIKGAQLHPLPEELSVYDIEGADRYAEVAESFMDVAVMVTEKIEGSNFSVTARTSGDIFVNQRNFTIVEIEGFDHTWWKVARRMGLVEFAKELATRYKDTATIYGECVGPGIQGNIYKLSDHRALLFDIKIGNRFLGASAFLEETDKLANSKEPTTIRVPLLALGSSLRMWLGNRSIVEASNGKSALADIAREGIVIRPMQEFFIQNFGRSIIKQRSPEYLLKSEF